jgi:hypothetical protein
VAFVYDGKLFPHKKKLSADKFYNIDEHWKHYTKWKKSVREG